MSELSVEITNAVAAGSGGGAAGDLPVFAPGHKLEGLARWSLDDAVLQIEIRLIWFTRGKGTQDVEVVDTVTYASPRPADQRTFHFKLPGSPYSFSGTLVSLTWALEMVAKGAEPERVEFVLSPFGHEIDLTRSAVTGN